jgi:hypothetical protein
MGGRNLLAPSTIGEVSALSACTPAGRASSAEGTHMKFIQRMNEQPSFWILLFGTAAMVGYLVYLVGEGITR